MTLKDIQNSDWYKTRPAIIQKAIDNYSPLDVYTLESGKQCTLISYEEPESGLYEDVTVTVQKNGYGTLLVPHGFNPLDTNKVFGVKLTDIKKLENDK